MVSFLICNLNAHHGYWAECFNSPWSWTCCKDDNCTNAPQICFCLIWCASIVFSVWNPCTMLKELFGRVCNEIVILRRLRFWTRWKICLESIKESLTTDLRSKHAWMTPVSPSLQIALGVSSKPKNEQRSNVAQTHPRLVYNFNKKILLYITSLSNRHDFYLLSVWYRTASK